MSTECHMGDVVRLGDREYVVCDGLPMTDGGYYLVRVRDIDTRELQPWAAFPAALVNLRQSVEDWR